MPEDVPFELRRLIERCLRKNPDRRRQHMDDVRLALQDLKEESDSGKLAAVAGVSVEPRKRWLTPTWLAAIVVVVAVAMAAGTWMLTRKARDTERSAAALIPKPLTTYPGWERWPSFSPDGERVAFEWYNQGQSDIYVKLVGSEGRQQLTTDPRNDLSPAWSPDGRQIAFGRFLSDNEAAVMLTPSIGGAERTLLRMPLGEWPVLGPYLTWHPSGE